MAETSTVTPPSGHGVSRARRWAGIGLAVGLALGLLLALAGVTVAVRTGSDPELGPTYRVVVLGIVVFRYPEDGELYQMRPFAQVRAARQDLLAASTFVGGVLGWAAGSAYGARAGRGSDRPPGS